MEIPQKLLAQHDHPAAAESAERFLQLNVRQKDGLYGTAGKLIRVLDEPSYAQWVTPPARVRFLDTIDGGVQAERTASRRKISEFDSLAFVAGGPQPGEKPEPSQDTAENRSRADTLFLLSMEGPAAATSLTTAFAAQLFDAGQLVATASPGRRLATPLLFILDEAANVCRIRALPDLYSHFGSRGMPVLTILQGWSQGVECWTEAGMQKLWSAANVKFYGGGVSEANFLRDLSTMVGAPCRVAGLCCCPQAIRAGCSGARRADEQPGQHHRGTDREQSQRRQRRNSAEEGDQTDAYGGKSAGSARHSIPYRVTFPTTSSIARKSWTIGLPDARTSPAITARASGSSTAHCASVRSEG